MFFHMSSLGTPGGSPYSGQFAAELTKLKEEIAKMKNMHAKKTDTNIPTPVLSQIKTKTSEQIHKVANTSIPNTIPDNLDDDFTAYEKLLGKQSSLPSPFTFEELRNSLQSDFSFTKISSDGKGIQATLKNFVVRITPISQSPISGKFTTVEVVLEGKSAERHSPKTLGKALQNMARL